MASASLTHFGGRAEPVLLRIEREHAFKKKKPNPETGKKRIGCEVCNAGRYAAQHLGAPPSLNEGGSGMDRMAFQSLKKAWQAAFMVELKASGLPRDLAAVQVEARVGFATRAKRDEGNHRWMIEKALGDALVEGGWLPDDCFYPVRRYSFGNLEGEHSPGRSWLELLLFPTLGVDG
jgi:hypothetical protein